MGELVQALRQRLHAGNGASPRPVPAPIAELPHFSAPEVSLILPVHSQPDLTAACVRAIAAGATVPYELIVVDDTATAATKDVVARIAGATVTVNDENLGYTRSLNRGAALARGPFLLFLNDDTAPEPGWLDAMLDCARSSDDIGVVVPLYLDQDGRVKEAGSIVWSDGSGWNFGRDDERTTRSRYLYRRDVDYGSGACLLIRTSLFREIGGLDEQFSPAYSEDVDLCFAAREAGMRVVYEPRARVLHVEGATSGTDVTGGNKRYQVVNQRLFADKWRHRLAEQPRRGLDPRLASDRSAGPRVLIADASVPAPDRDGGAERMWRLILGFRGLGCPVTLLPADGEVTDRHAAQLESEGVEVLRGPADAERELASIGPALDLALLSGPHVVTRYAYLLRELAPGARIACDGVGLHHLRGLLRDDALCELERALVRCCDVTVVATEEQREDVLAAVPDAEVAVVPTSQQVPAEVPPLEGRSWIVFVGSFVDRPDADVARFLVERVMPRVWEQRPDARLRIVGRQPSADVQALAGARVDVIGWLEDLAAVLPGARVAIAPIRRGTDLQHKAVEAMAHGVPVVTTTHGAEALAAADRLLIADEPEEIAEKVTNLLADDELWRRLSDAGRAHVRDRFAPEVVTPRLQALLAPQPSR